MCREMEGGMVLYGANRTAFGRLLERSKEGGEDEVGRRCGEVERDGWVEAAAAMGMDMVDIAAIWSKEVRAMMVCGARCGSEAGPLSVAVDSDV